MKSRNNCRIAHGIGTTATFLLGLIGVCSFTPAALGQSASEWNRLEPPPSAPNGTYHFDDSGQTGPAVNQAQGWTSLGSYNSQNQTLVAPPGAPSWRPPENDDLAAPSNSPVPNTSPPDVSQGSAIFSPPSAKPWLPPEPSLTGSNPADAGQGSPIFNPVDHSAAETGSGSGLPSTTTPQPSGIGLSKIILPNGSLISVPAETFPASNPIAGDAGSSFVPTAKGWRSYVCRGERNAKDGAAVAATLKGLGVENEALNTLTEAMSSHSVLVAVVAISGLEFYRYNCP
jgi:hypothetical protein